MHGINRFSRFGHSFHISVREQYQEMTLQKKYVWVQKDVFQSCNSEENKLSDTVLEPKRETSDRNVKTG